MEDIELAKKYLEEYNLAIAVVKNGNIIYKSKDRGIKPMYILATNMKDILVGTSIADKVIGKGAAMLCNYIGVKEVYGELISNNAIEELEKGGILYTYNEICPYIKNRNKTDLCPIEKLTINIHDPKILLEKIVGFL